MKFVVHGVDRSSGQEVSLPLDAASTTEAESIASLSMLVAEVTVDARPVEAVPYARPTTDAGGFDWPAGILRQARVLRGLSWAVAAVGALGVIAPLAAHLTLWIDNSFLAEIVRLLRLVSEGDVGSSIGLLVLACIMRLAAHFMLGLRQLLLRKIDRQN